MVSMQSPGVRGDPMVSSNLVKTNRNWGKFDILFNVHLFLGLLVPSLSIVLNYCFILYFTVGYCHMSC